MRFLVYHVESRTSRTAENCHWIVGVQVQALAVWHEAPDEPVNGAKHGNVRFRMGWMADLSIMVMTRQRKLHPAVRINRECDICKIYRFTHEMAPKTSRLILAEVFCLNFPISEVWTQKKERKKVLTENGRVRHDHLQPAVHNSMPYICSLQPKWHP